MDGSRARQTNREIANTLNTEIRVDKYRSNLDYIDNQGMLLGSS